MCLITSLKKSLIATEDFVCYKQLLKGKQSYYSPLQETEVELNKVLKTKEPDIIYESVNCYKRSIGAGFIHAYIRQSNNCFQNKRIYVFVKCICRKGTEYYIDDYVEEICARELYITDEIIDFENISFNYNNFIKIFSPIINKDSKILIGDYFLSDKTFAHVRDYNGKKEVIGVVSCITKNREVIITALHENCLKWSTQEEIVEGLVYKYSFDSAYKDMNGRDHTDVIINSKQFSDKKYPAFAFINKYFTKGTKKGDWYLPSIRELYLIALNMLKVNIALLLLNDKNVNLLTYNNIQVSSTERDDKNVWYCLMDNAEIYFTLKNDLFQVRPAIKVNIKK